MYFSASKAEAPALRLTNTPRLVDNLNVEKKSPFCRHLFCPNEPEIIIIPRFIRFLLAQMTTHFFG